MDSQKEKERSALRATIWRMANDMRGRIDGWDFKHYIFGMLFYRFISENLSSYVQQIYQEKTDKYKCQQTADCWH